MQHCLCTAWNDVYAVAYRVISTYQNIETACAELRRCYQSSVKAPQHPDTAAPQCRTYVLIQREVISNPSMEALYPTAAKESVNAALSQTVGLLKALDDVHQLGLVGCDELQQ